MIACLWFPNWPIQRLRRAQRNRKSPLLRQTVALFDAQRKIVASDRPELVGLPVAEALGAHLAPHDAAADRQALERLAEWCDQFSPTVGVEPDGLLLDILGLPFDVEHVGRALAARGLEARLAVAPTVGAAWAGAHYDEPLPLASLLLDSQPLASLPLAALRLPPATIALLHELGLRHLAELQALPRARLAARFPEVVRRLDQFTGVLAEPITPHRQSPAIVVEQDLEYPLQRHDMVEAVLAQVVERVAAELAQRGRGALRAEFVLRCQERSERFAVGLYRASAAPRYLLELLLLQLKSLPGPLLGVRATVPVSAPLETRQRELFDDHRDRQRQLAAFVDRLNCRTPVLRARLVADAHPEHAFRYVSVVDSRRPTGPPRVFPPRPLLVEPRPVAIEMIAVGGAPGQFQWQGESYRVSRCWGPERIQTGWWRGGYRRRDYYRVQTQRGCYWLFRAQGKWFLQGVFD